MDLLRVWLGRIFKIHPEDWKPLLLLQALIVSICTVIAATKTVANALFVSHVGVGYLPYTYMASAAVLVLSGFLLIPLIDQLPRLAIYRTTTISLAVLFGLSFLAMLAHQTWVYYLAYVLSTLADSLLFLEFWLVAQDLCDSRQAKRIFPLVIGWSLIGGIIGSFGTKFLVAFIHTEYLLLVSGGLLLSTLGLIQMVQKAFPRETGHPAVQHINYTIGKWPRLKLDMRIVKDSGLVRLICWSLVLYSVLAFLTDFLFNTVCVQHFTVAGKVQVDRLTAFYGFFDGISITVSLVFQFFLVNRILRAMGLTNAQLVLPGMFGVGFSSIFLSNYLGNVQAAFFPTLGTRLGQKFLSSSLHRSSMTILYSPIPSEKRGRSKAFAEGIIQPAGVFVAGILILCIKVLPLVLVAAIAVAFSTLYIFMMLRLRRVYLHQILKMFEDKNFGVLESFAGMFARIGEKEILDKLCVCLADKDFNIRNFVVELLGEIQNKSAIDPLIDLFHNEENPTVKATVVTVLGKLGTPRIVPLLREALQSANARIKANAIEAVMASKNTELCNAIGKSITDAHPRISTNAAIAVWRLKITGEIPKAMAMLSERYRNGTLPQKLSALYAFGEIATSECMNMLIEATRQSDQKILSRAVLSLGSTRSEIAAKTLIELLPFVNSSLQNLITASLIKLAPYCPDLMLRSLQHPDIYSRRHLIIVAATMEDRRVRDALKDVALAEIDAVHHHLEWQEKIRRIGQKEVERLFYDTFEQLNNQAKENVLEVLKVLAGNTPAIQRILKDLFHPNRFVRASALDALEAVGHKVIARAFVPILEEKPAVDAAHAAPASEEEVLSWTRHWLKSPYRWVRACGAFTVGKMRLQALQQELLSCLSDAYDLVRANAIEALAQFDMTSNRLYVERMLKDPSPLPRRYAQEFLRG